MLGKKRYLAALLAVVITLSALVTALPIPAYAATCRISFSDPTATVGEKITVRMYISENIAACDIYLTYDTNYLTFNSVSGGVGNLSGSGGSGSVRVFDYYSSGEGTFSCNISFTTKKAGSTAVKVSSFDISDGGGDSMQVSSASSAVTIEAVQELSSDATLKSLSINPGTLSPSFSASTTSYKASVVNTVKKIAVTAKANDSNATVSISGNTSLSVGTNNVKVTVKAEDGTTKTYTIKVTRAEGEKDPESEKEPETEDNKLVIKLSDNSEFTVIEPEAADIPAGFTKKDFTYDKLSIPLYYCGDTLVPLVYGTHKKETEPSFRFLDTENRKLYDMKYVKYGPEGKAELLALLPLSTFEAPESYVAAEAMIGSVSVTAFKTTKATEINHYLLYALDAEGKAGYYLYDIKDSVLQRYNFAIIDSNAIANEQLEELTTLRESDKAMKEQISSLEEAILEKDKALNEIELENDSLKLDADDAAAKIAELEKYANVEESFTDSQTYKLILFGLVVVMTLLSLGLGMALVEIKKTTKKTKLKYKSINHKEIHKKK